MSLIKYELKNLRLVTFNPQDLEKNGVTSKYLNWFGDKEVTAHNSHGLFPQTKKGLDEFFEEMNSNKIIVMAIIHKENNIHIGNIALQRFDWINRSAELAIVMGEKDYWKKGYATIACKCLLYHGFMKLNIHRLWTGTSETNTGMQKLAKKIGMIQEGVFKDAMFLNGEYRNIYEYGMICHAFKNNFPDDKDFYINQGIV